MLSRWNVCFKYSKLLLSMQVYEEVQIAQLCSYKQINVFMPYRFQDNVGEGRTLKFLLKKKLLSYDFPLKPLLIMFQCLTSLDKLLLFLVIHPCN